MKIFAISDLHLSTAVDKPMDIFGGAWLNYWEDIKEDWQKKVGAEDIVLIAGDISWGMTLEEAQADLDEIAKLPGKKVFIKGNHDLWWSSYSKVKSVLADDMYAIQNNSVKIGEVVIAGTRGWTVAEDGAAEDDVKIFLREQQRLKLSLDDAKGKLKDGERLILMMHYPPYNAKYDDSEFTKIIDEYGVKTVVFGHLHGRNCRADLHVTKNGADYFLTSCDQLQNKLIEL